MQNVKELMVGTLWLVALGILAANWNGFASAIATVAGAWFDGLQVLQRRDI